MTSFIRVGSIDCNTMPRMRTWGERLCNGRDTELLRESRATSFIRMGSVDWETVLRSLGNSDEASLYRIAKITRL